MAGSALHLIVATGVRRHVLSGHPDAGAVSAHPEEYLLGSLGADIWYTPSLDLPLPGAPVSLSLGQLYDALGGPDSPLFDVRSLLGEIQAARDSHDLARALKVLSAAPVAVAALAARVPTFTDLLFQVLPAYITYKQQTCPLATVTGWTEPDWGWGDLLHWRRTGRFANNLWTVAQELSGEPGERLKAFALGYLTHIATDVTSHAYVNQIVGAPARALGAVAHLVEGYMDVYAWNRRPLFGDGDLNDADLGRLLPGRIDAAFARGVDDALRRTYEEDAGAKVPRAPGLDGHTPDLFAAHAVDLRTYLTLLGTYFAAPQPARPSVAGVTGFMEKLAEVGPPPGLPPVPDIGGPPGGPGWPPTSWQPTMRALKAFVEDLIGGAATAAEAWLAWTADLIELAVVGAWQAGWDVIDAALFAAELPLYGLLASYRWLPARMGFAYPLREELEPRFYTPPDPGLLDFPQAHAGPLTVLHWLREDAFGLDDLLDRARHESGREDPPTVAGPYRDDDDPLILVDGSPGRPPSPRPHAWFAADGPDETDAANRALTAGGSLGLGSAIDLCRTFLPAGVPVSAAMAALPDLNLDADRGYGYLCWYHWSDRAGRPATNPLLGAVVEVGYRPDF